MPFIRKITLYLFATFVLSFQSTAQYKIEVLDSNTFTLGEGVVLSKTSFRGLSVVDDQTIWVSGSRGTVARSIDGGKTFTYNQLKGYEKSDFRDIEAFDSKRAIIMSSGTPAYVLKTIDGGQTWKEVYKNTDTAYFLDAMDFWDDQRGVLVGDPINGHFVLLQTNDGGETWQELDTTKTPKAMEGEAVFAASGTSLRCMGGNDFGFVTGGMQSRLIYFEKSKFDIVPLPITHGSQSRGAFSFSNISSLIIVGGDYLVDTLNQANILREDNSWETQSHQIIIPPLNERLTQAKNGCIGYMSCVAEISATGPPKNLFVACGTKGVAKITTWPSTCSNVSSEPFHVVRKAKKGKAVFLAGPKGKIGKLIY